MKAGKLDREIKIERATTTVNEFGTPVETWASVATLRAEIVTAETVEAAREHGASTEAAIAFRTRFIDGITVADRLTYAGRTYDIKAVSEIGRRRGLEIRAVARGM